MVLVIEHLLFVIFLVGAASGHERHSLQVQLLLQLLLRHLDRANFSVVLLRQRRQGPAVDRRNLFVDVLDLIGSLVVS